MYFFTEAEEIIKVLGLFRGLWVVISLLRKRLWLKFSNVGYDYGYIVRWRKISSRYRTRTAGVITHEIEIQAMRDNVSHYQGRYLRRSKSDLTVKSPHHEAHPTEVDNQFQKFTIELEKILTKGETTKIVMEVDWEDESHMRHPQSVFTPLCRTNSLEFVVIVPSHEKIIKAMGVVSHHPGMHMPMSRDQLSVNDGILTWKPHRADLLFAYKVTWEWSKDS